MAVDTRRVTRLRVAQRSRRGQIRCRSRLGVRNTGLQLLKFNSGAAIVVKVLHILISHKLHP